MPGTPITFELSGISLVITDPAPITHHFPIETPGRTTAPAPIKVPSPKLTPPVKTDEDDKCKLLSFTGQEKWTSGNGYLPALESIEV